MKKQQLTNKIYAITFKKRNPKLQKGFALNNLNKDFDKEKEKDSYESPTKSKPQIALEDGKSQTNKSTKEKKSLPSLIPPSSVNPIRKMVAQKALYDYMKNLGVVNNYQDKQALHHETLTLKQKNNELTVQNMKLKTKIMNLDTEIVRMQKMLEEDIDAKYPGTKQSRLKSNEQSLISTKLMLRQTRKQLNAIKEQNLKIKKTIKFTRISELQAQRNILQQQTLRLKQLLQQQVAENVTYKIKSNSKSQLQQQYFNLQQSNMLIKKELIECSKKLKANEEKLKVKPDTEKNSSKIINELKRTVKEKTIEIENLKKGKEEVKEQRGIRSASLNKSKIVRLKCQQCTNNKTQIKSLKQKITQLQKQILQMKQSTSVFQDIMIKKPKPAQLQQVSSFLRYRFKAHHLSFDNLLKYLIKVDSEKVSVGAMVENLLVQPFFLIHPTYLETMIAYLFYADSDELEVKANQDFQKDITIIKQLFTDLIKPYDLFQARKQQQIFIQIAQIITQHCDHISAAFQSKRNGQGTISKASLNQFLTYIQLNQQYIEFIITQIVLESTDLQHLNYFSLFEIFYLPNTNFGSNGNIQAVKELDEEYQESQQSGRVRGVEKHDTIGVEEDQEYQEIFEEEGDGKEVIEVGEEKEGW